MWERLDGVLADTFGALVGSRGGAATAAYGTIVASSTRTDMLGVASEIVLRKDAFLLDATKSLLGRVAKMSTRRNDIAHGVVGHFVEDHHEAEGTRRVDHGYYLTPAGYATRKRSKIEREYGQPMMLNHVYAYTADQVEAYGRQFKSLHDEAAQLMLVVQAYVNVRWPLGEDQPRDAPASAEKHPPTD